jgi:hypothetical protein
MAGGYKKIVLVVKQKLRLNEKFENGDLATKLTKDYGVEIECCIHKMVLPGSLPQNSCQ